MISINETQFIENPKNSLERIEEENDILQIVCDKKGYVVIDEDDWKNIAETLHLNSIKGYSESIIEASKEDLSTSLPLKKLDW